MTAGYKIFLPTILVLLLSSADLFTLAFADSNPESGSAPQEDHPRESADSPPAEGQGQASIVANATAFEDAATTQGAEPAGASPADPAVEPNLFDPEDGWLDVSEFLGTRAGFIAVPIILTEPALGYGGGLGAMFVEPRSTGANGERGRPNLTFAGGAATENGTWMAFLADVRHWRQGRIKSQSGAFGGRVRLDFYGIGERELQKRPVGYQLDLVGTSVGAQVRAGHRSIRLGAGYRFAHVKTSFSGFDIALILPDRERIKRVTRLSGPSFEALWDSRDTIFTPRRGFYARAALNTGFEGLGSSSNFQILEQTLIAYQPLSEDLTLGLRFDFRQSFGAPAFYVQPAIAMRGIQAQRYQGQRIVQGEAELRWQFWRRFSLVAFGGGGGANAKFGQLKSERSVGAGGAGIRYELARQFGLHYGVDVAWGPDGGAFYIQMGSAWMHP